MKLLTLIRSCLLPYILENAERTLHNRKAEVSFVK